jgi:hypothetical protein
MNAGRRLQHPGLDDPRAFPAVGARYGLDDLGSARPPSHGEGTVSQPRQEEAFAMAEHSPGNPSTEQGRFPPSDT